jgi:hypothetical protein
MLSYTIPAHLRGDTWNGIDSVTITLSGVPVNITDSTIRMQLREDIDSPVALELSTNNGHIVISDGANGVFQIPPTLITIPFGTYKYDIQVTFSNGINKTFITGTWQITPDITE